jgi:hypothetical protein
VIISVIGILAILLITYWWGSSGAFSAMIHFLCVVTSGCIAFAVWEPIAYRMLGGGSGEYAKGLVLLGTFIAVVVVLRLFSDRYIPMNLSLPRAADVLLGGAFGLASGVLTIGFLVIAIGFFQSTVTIGDYTGWSRRSDVPAAPAIGSDNAPILGAGKTVSANQGVGVGLAAAFTWRIFSEMMATRLESGLPSAPAVRLISSKIGLTTSTFIRDKILTTVLSSMSFTIATTARGVRLA